MKTHLAVSLDRVDGSTLTTTLCGRMNAQSEDGMNSTEDRAKVTCAFCRHIILSPTYWRHRKYLNR